MAIDLFDETMGLLAEAVREQDLADIRRLRELDR